MANTVDSLNKKLEYWTNMMSKRKQTPSDSNRKDPVIDGEIDLSKLEKGLSKSFAAIITGDPTSVNTFDMLANKIVSAKKDSLFAKIAEFTKAMTNLMDQRTQEDFIRKLGERIKTSVANAQEAPAESASESQAQQARIDLNIIGEKSGIDALSTLISITEDKAHALSEFVNAAMRMKDITFDSIDFGIENIKSMVDAVTAKDLSGVTTFFSSIGSFVDSAVNALAKDKVDAIQSSIQDIITTAYALQSLKDLDLSIGEDLAESIKGLADMSSQISIGPGMQEKADAVFYLRELIENIANLAQETSLRENDIRMLKGSIGIIESVLGKDGTVSQLSSKLSTKTLPDLSPQIAGLRSIDALIKMLIDMSHVDMRQIDIARENMAAIGSWMSRIGEVDSSKSLSGMESIKSFLSKAHDVLANLSSEYDIIQDIVVKSQRTDVGSIITAISDVHAIIDKTNALAEVKPIEPKGLFMVLNKLAEIKRHKFFTDKDSFVEKGKSIESLKSIFDNAAELGRERNAYAKDISGITELSERIQDVFTVDIPKIVSSIVDPTKSMDLDKTRDMISKVVDVIREITSAPNKDLSAAIRTAEAVNEWIAKASSINLKTGEVSIENIDKYIEEVSKITQSAVSYGGALNEVIESLTSLNLGDASINVEWLSNILSTLRKALDKSVLTNSTDDVKKIFTVVNDIVRYDFFKTTIDFSKAGANITGLMDMLSSMRNFIKNIDIDTAILQDTLSKDTDTILANLSIILGGDGKDGIIKKITDKLSSVKDSVFDMSLAKSITDSVDLFVETMGHASRLGEIQAKDIERAKSATSKIEEWINSLSALKPGQGLAGITYINGFLRDAERMATAYDKASNMLKASIASLDGRVISDTVERVTAMSTIVGKIADTLDTTIEVDATIKDAVSQLDELLRSRIFKPELDVAKAVENVDSMADMVSRLDALNSISAVVDIEAVRKSVEKLQDFFTGKGTKDGLGTLPGLWESISKSNEKLELTPVKAIDEAFITLRSILESMRDTNEKASVSVAAIDVALGRIDQFIQDLTDGKHAKMLNRDYKAAVGNVLKLRDAISEMKGAFGEIEGIGLMTSIEGVRRQLIGIQDFYTNDVARTADASRRSKADLEAIKGGAKDVRETIDEASKTSEKEQRDNQMTAYEMVKSVMMLGTLMLVGGYIIKKNPELVLASMAFGVTLMAFIGSVMAPFVLIKKLNSDKENKIAISGVAQLVISSAAVMLIGAALFSAYPGLAKDSIKFGATLMAFTTMMMLPLQLIKSIVSKDASDMMESFGEFIVKASATMLIGAAFMLLGGGKLVKASLMFGGTLALFITMTALPVMLFGKMVDTDKSMSNVTKFIVACAATMLIGALFMSIGNGKVAKAALMFGAVLGLFIASVIAPIFLASKLMLHDFDKAVNSVRKLVVTCTAIMVLGAAFMALSGGKLAVYALTFGVVLGTFIALVLAPVLIFGLLMRKVAITLIGITAFMVVVTGIMLIGAIFMGQDPSIPKNALLFGGTLALFVAGILAPFILYKKSLTEAMPSMALMLMLVVGSAAALIAGAWAINEFGGWSVLGFAVILEAFVAGLVGIFAKWGKQINASIWTAGALSMLVGVSAASMIGLAAAVDKYGVGTVLIAAGTLLAFVGIVAALSRLLNSIKAEVTMSIETAGGIAIMVGTLTLSLFLLAELIENHDIGVIAGGVLLLTVIMAEMGALLWAISALAPSLPVAGTTIIALGASILMLTGALWLIDKVVEEAGDRLPVDIATLTTIMVGLGVFYSVMGEVGGKAVEGGIVIAAIGASMLMLSGALWIIDEIVKDGHVIADLGVMMTIMVGLEFFYSAVATLAAPTLAGAAVIAAIGASMLLMSGALLIIHAIVKDGADTLEELKVLGLLAAGLLGFYMIVAGMGIAVAAGALVVVAMSGAFAALAGVFYLVDKIVGNDDSIKDKTNKLVEATLGTDSSKGLIDIINAMSLKLGLKALGAPGVALLIGETVGNLARAFDLVNKVSTGNLSANINSMHEAIVGKDGKQGVKDIIETIKSIDDVKKASASIYAIGIAFQELGRAIDITSNVQGAISSIDIGSFNDAISKYITVFDSIPGEEDVNKYAAKTYMFSTLANRISRVIAKMAQSVADISSMNVAMEWNSKGDPTKYRSLSSQDFTNAAENIQTILTTIGGAIINLYNGKVKNVDGISADDVKSMFDPGWLTDSPFTRVIKRSTEMGGMISNIAEGIAAYAALQIPIQWNDNGKPIKYRSMTPTDFAAASASIATIISTLGGTIAGIAAGKVGGVFYDINGNPNPLSGEELKKLLAGENSEAYNKVLDGSVKLGELISSISQGIAAYADLKIPTRWKDGKPAQFMQLKDDMFPQVGINIAKVVSALASGIAGASGTIDDISNKSITKMVNFTKSVVEITSGTADAIANIAKMRIPTKIGANGKPEGYMNFDDTNVPTAIGKIKGIISAIGTAISEAIEETPELTDKKIVSKVLDSIKPMTDLVKDVSNTIVNYANGIMGTGKSYDIVSLASKAGSNIASIVSCVATALIKLYNGVGVDGMSETQQQAIKEMFSDNDKDTTFKKVVSSVSSITDIVKGISEGIAVFAKGGIPEYDKDGKVVGYKAYSDDYGTKAGKTIGDVLTAVADAVIAAYDGNKDKFNTTEGSTIGEAVNAIGGISGIVKNVAEGIQAYANMYIPVYGEKGEIKEKKKFGINDFIEAQANITWMIIAVADATRMAMMHVNAIFGKEADRNMLEEYRDSMEIQTSVISQVVTTIQSIADLKVPTGYNADGTVNGYNVIDRTTITEIGGRILSLINAIPSAISAAVSGFDADAMTDNAEKISTIVTRTNTTIGMMIESISTIADKTDLVSQLFSYKPKTTIEDKTVSGIFVDLVSAINGYRAFNQIMKEITDTAASDSVSNMVKAVASITQSIGASIGSTMDVSDTIASAFSYKPKSQLKEGTGAMFGVFLDLAATLNAYKDFNQELGKMGDVKVNDVASVIGVLNANMMAMATTVGIVMPDDMTKSFRSVATGIDMISKSTESFSLEKNKNFKNHVDSLGKYVKSINSIDLSRVRQLQSLIDAMTEMANSIDGLDKFTETLSERMAGVLEELTKRIESAEKTIKEADEIQTNRQRLIKESVEQIKNIMGNTLNVQVRELTNEDIMNDPDTWIGADTNNDGYVSDDEKNTFIEQNLGNLNYGQRLYAQQRGDQRNGAKKPGGE